MSRLRVRTEPNVSELLSVDFSKGGTDTTIGPFLTYRKSESMSDILSPSYSSRLAKGEIINNPCSYVYSSQWSIGSGSGSYSDNAGTTSYSLSGPLSQYRIPNISNPYPDLGAVPNLVQDSNLQALAGIDKPALETGEDLLELRETVKLLLNPLQGITRGLGKVYHVYNTSKKYRTRYATVADFLSDRWLEYRFAFSPTIRSIHGILTQISQPTGKPSEIRRSHGRATYSKSASKESNVEGMSFVGNASRDVSVHSVVIYKINNPVHDFRWRYGLRNKDFPKNFWAVMPYSFMVDRIYNVSSAISALSNLSDPSVNVLAASTTIRDRLVKSYQHTGHSQAGWSISASGEVVCNEDFSLTRNVWRPGISDVPPPLKVSGLIDTTTKIADITALIYSAIRR